MRKQVYNSTTDRVEVLKDFMSNMTNEELAKYSLFPVQFGSKPDSRYFTFTEVKEFENNVYSITYVPVERDLQEVKDRMIKQIKEIQAEKLSKIDWYWLREMKDSTKTVPQEIKDESAYIYSTSGALEGTIQASTTMQELIDFEHDAYEGEVDEIDADTMLPTGNKITTTLYKNNVTDW